MVSPSLELVSRFNSLPNEMRSLIAQHFNVDDIHMLLLARHKIDLANTGICLDYKDFDGSLLGCFDDTNFAWDPQCDSSDSEDFWLHWFIEYKYQGRLDISGTCLPGTVPYVPICKRLKFSQ
jgi:hypothetical protein